MKIRILGSGTSMGVPTLGCDCEVCRSADPHDKRLRSSSLLYTKDAVILIDCGPDFRQQMMQVKPFVVPDAILITHEHADHVGGLDDLRPSNVFGDVTVFAEDYTARDLRTRLPYCFTKKKYPGVPGIKLHVVKPFQPFKVKDTEILPIRVMHGELPILGFRIGKLGYITDMKTMPEESFDALQGLDFLIMNALQVSEHPAHQNIAQAVKNALRIGAKETYFIHMSHHAGFHAVADRQLPPHIHFAYDGLEIEF
ncbi:MAG: MBL fold metallo-hydrolase [Bacteroidaceae bacterium]|nr:MBL fold metallo-hydrolase [Bacteroidaceae bacterium]